MIKPYIVGVAGGSGSGKTYFSRELQRALGQDRCLILYQDNYYIDQSASFDGDGGMVNFDHPSSLDFGLLAEDLSRLKSNQNIEVPIYEFSTHKRLDQTITFKPAKIILLDGILILDSKVVRAQLDEAIFFDTPEELRFKRRLARDVSERGRTPEGVTKQFQAQVRPMHQQFVQPSMQYAQVIVRELGDYQEVLTSFINRFKKF